MVEEQLVVAEPIQQQLAGQGGTQFEGFQLPFPIATLADLGQRAYLRNGKVEWLYARVHEHCRVKKEPGRMLRDNKESILCAFDEHSVPRAEWHYKGKEQGGDDSAQDHDVSPHTVESRGFLVLLLWMLKNKSLKAINKVKALSLLLDLVEKSFAYADKAIPIMVQMVGRAGNLVSQEVLFSAQGLSTSLKALLDHSLGLTTLWKKLGSRCWLNRCISSSPENVSLSDFVFFLAYLYCHPKLAMDGQRLWLVFGKLSLAELLVHIALWMTSMAEDLGNQTLKALPVLRGKTGQARKVADPINKILLLWKLRKEKVHRQRVAATHTELGGASSRMMAFEHYIDCLLHSHALAESFDGCRQLSVSWGPSTYGGKDTFFGVVYDAVHDKAAYLLSQQLGTVVLSELGTELVPLAKSRKLTRIDGYKEIRGLSAALRSIGLSLEAFSVPPGLRCYPLAPHELRIVDDDGRAWILNEKTGAVEPEVPDGIDLGGLPHLVSISDQGPSNMAALSYIAYSCHALLLHAIFDPYHRAWNDLKMSLRKAKCRAWRCVLELTLVANMNYGPFGSSSWYFKKKKQGLKIFSWQGVFLLLLGRDTNI